MTVQTCIIQGKTPITNLNKNDLDYVTGSGGQWHSKSDVNNRLCAVYFTKSLADAHPIRIQKLNNPFHYSFVQ